MVDTVTGSDGNHDQIVMIAKAMAESMAEKYAPKPDTLPAPVKWFGGIAAAVMTAGAVAFTIWLATTLADTQDTTIRIEERQNFMATQMTSDMGDLKNRVGRLENYHREGGSR